MSFEEYEDLEFTIDKNTLNRVEKEYEIPFTMVANVLIYDTRLTWKAKGIYSYLASCKPDWQFKMEEIVKVSKDGLASLRSGIKELEEYGYLKREPLITPEGFKGLDWILSLPQHADNQWYYGFSREEAGETQVPDIQWQAGFMEGMKHGGHETGTTYNNTNKNNTNKNNTKSIDIRSDFPETSTWRTDYTIYANMVLDGKQKLLADTKTRNNFERWYPNINFVASVEKTADWWIGKEEGWAWLKNKRMKRTNFYSRLKNNLDKNIVYRSRFTKPPLDDVKYQNRANDGDNLNA